MSFALHSVVLMVIVDFAWSAYVKLLAAKKTFRAAVWSSAIVLMGSFTAIEYVTNHWLVVPAALGAFVGTYLSVVLDKD